MDWTCTAEPDEIAWYVAFLWYAAVGWFVPVCPKRSHGTLLSTRYRGPGLRCCTRRDSMVRCFSTRSIVWCQEGCSLLASWELQGLALLYITDALADIMSCCNCHCTAAALNLHRCPLRGIVPVLCTTLQVTVSRQKPTTCALRRSGTRIKSLPCEWRNPLASFPVP